MTHWDKVLASAPLNKEAATVTSDSLEPHTFRGDVTKSDHFLSDGPAAIRAPLRDPSFIDLTGQRFGRFTVIGLALEQHGGKAVRKDQGPYWVVRLRRAKDESRLACGACNYAEDVKAGFKSIRIDRGKT